MSDPVAPVPLNPKVHGINWNPPHYYYADQPWTNRFQTARRFAEYPIGSPTRSNLGLTDPRPDGYPASLPAGIEARTACAGARNVHVGTWVCAWDGDGTVRFDTGNGNTQQAGVNGRIERTIVTAPDRMAVAIVTTNPANPVRNIRVFYKPYEAYLLGHGLDPDFMARWSHARVNAARFANWMDSANIQHVTASEIVPDEYYTDSGIDDNDDESNYTRTGCRLKLVGAVCQHLQLDYAMIQAPVRVWEDPTDSWLRTVIPYVLGKMKPTGRIILGVGNEVWLGIFFGTSYFQNAGVNGIPGVCPAFTQGSAFDKMCKAYALACKRVFAAARQAAQDAGFDPNRVLRMIECQAASGLSYFHNLRTHDWTNEAAPVPIAHEIYSPSSYYGNNLGVDQALALTGVTGSFQVGEVVHNGLAGNDRREGTFWGIINGRHVVAINRGSFQPFAAGQSLIGETSGAQGTISDDGLPNTFLPSWSPEHFYAYARMDMDFRSYAGPEGLIAAANLAATRNATILSYEGGDHMYSPSYSAPALAALEAWYDSDLCRQLYLEMHERLRALPFSNGHSMYYDSGGYPWGLYRSWLDDGGVRPGHAGVDGEKKYQAFVEAGNILLGGGGGTNFAPSITSPGQGAVLPANELQPGGFTVTWTDPNPSDTHTVTYVDLPPWATGTPQGVVTWSSPPLGSSQQPWPVTIRVTDQGGLFDEIAVSIAVAKTNLAPSIIEPNPQTALEGQPFAFQASWTDPNPGDTHTVTWDDGEIPSGLTGNPDGSLTGTPDVGTAGQYSIPFRVTDQGGLFDDGVLELEVQPNGPANLPPVLQNPGPQFLREGEPWSLQLQHTDPNPGQTHTYDYPVKPGAVNGTSGGLLSWTPGAGAAAGSPYTVTARVTDDGVPPLDDQETFLLHVAPAAPQNVRPSLVNPGNQLATEGVLWSVQVYWTDPNPDDTHVVTWDGLPPWCAGNAAGLAAGIPPLGAAAASPHTITVRVTDQGGLFDEKTFVLTVQAGGSGGPQLNFSLNLAGASTDSVRPLLREHYLRVSR